MRTGSPGPVLACRDMPSRSDIVRIVVFVLAVRVLLYAWGAIWTVGEVPFHQMWMRWDADNYLTLASEGYAAPDQPEDRREFMSRFPPLVPWAIGVVGAALRIDGFAAGVLLSLASLTGASVLLWMLALEIGYGRDEAWRAVVLLNIFPVSYFGNSAFSEPPFLLLVTGYLLLVARGALIEWRAGVLTLAILARTVGLVLYPIHVVHVWQAYARGASVARALALLVGPAVPLLATQLWTRFGLGLSGYGSDHAVNLRITDPIPFLEQFRMIATTLSDPARLLDTHFVWTAVYPALFLLGAVVICASGWRRLPGYLNAYSVLYLGLLSLLRFNISGPRYCWPLIPIFLILATTGRTSFRVTVACFGIGLLYFTSVFVMGRWAF